MLGRGKYAVVGGELEHANAPAAKVETRRGEVAFCASLHSGPSAGSTLRPTPRFCGPRTVDAEMDFCELRSCVILRNDTDDPSTRPIA